MVKFIKRGVVLLFVATLLGSAQAAVVFPVKYSANNRYLVDQNGTPFPILGRTAWFIVSLPVGDYQTFVDDSAARGYSAIELHVINHDPRGNHPPFNGNGDLPFLKRLDGTTWNGLLCCSAPDFTTPNEAYWSFVDGLLSYCESKGILVFMFPAYVGYQGSDQGWMQEIVANGTAKMQSYGAWIATRYKNQKNLVWMMGGDMGTPPNAFNGTQTAVEDALLTGLKSVTGQQSEFFSAEWDSESIATDQTSFGTQMTLNGAYSHNGYVNTQGRRAYAYSPAMPSFLVEGPYDQEGSDGNGWNGAATQPVRRFQWWACLSTIGGYISGNGYVWPFRSPDWQNHLDTQGSRDMGRLNAFIGSIAWYQLVPSDLGGMRTLITAGGSSVSFSDYVAAAATPGGTLLVAYVPPAHNGPITVDMGAMGGPTRARWFDPTSAAYANIGTGLTNTGTRVFSPPGNNSVGAKDWVLVLDYANGNPLAPPTISDIPDQATTVNTPTAAIPFTIGDADTAVGSLTLNQGSSNQPLVPTNNIVFGGSGTNRTVTVTPAASQTGVATITVSVSDGTNTTSDTFVLTVNAVNTPPTITGIADQTINEDTSTAAQGFTVGDGETAPASLTLVKGSSNPSLVPTNNIAFGGAGANRTLTVTPAANQNGAATITVSVSDGQYSVSTNFVVTVNAVNDPPTITGVPNQTINVNSSTGPLNFMIGDVDTAVGSLTVSADSSNPTLVPANNIVLGGSGTSRTVTVTPTSNQLGSATITVAVSDGQYSVSTNFGVTVSSLVLGTQSFTNTATITIPDSGKATPYPSTINVSGLGGTITNMSVTLRNLNQTWASDVDVLLVGPGGQKVVLMSDAGHGGANNVTLTLSDAAAAALPVSGLVSGTFRPTNHSDSSPGGDNFPAPAPAGPHATALSTFNGQSANGVWSLYVFDDGPGDLGSFAGGFSLSLTTVVAGGSAAPTISDILDQTTTANTPTAAIPFTINDADTPVGNLTLSANSSNPALVPTNNIVFGGSGANRTVTVTPASNQAGSGTITIAVSDGVNSASDTFVLTVNAVNTPPTITGIADRTINEDTSTAALAFTVGDAETAPGSLLLSRSSSNPGLVPTNSIVFGGSGANRAVTVSPSANQTGTATITVTVSDGQYAVSTNFVVTVNAVNDSPTITGIADQTINENTSTGPLSFVVGDVETSASSLTLSAESSNLVLVPTDNIMFGGSGSNRTVTVTLANAQTGTATITLVVSDGQSSVSTGFVVAVNHPPTITGIADQTIDEDHSTGPLSFTVGDVETAAGSLALRRDSSNPTLVPVNNIVFGGSGDNQTVTVTPATDQNGTAIVTLTVDDGALSVSTSFVITVNAVNDPPTITGIADQTTDVNHPTAALSFSVGDAETATDSLTLSAETSNPVLAPTNNIVFGGSGSNRTVTVSPITEQSGIVTITLTVDDGQLSVSTNFIVTVNAVDDPPTITGIANRTIDEDTSTGPLSFAVGDVETPADSLNLGAGSSNQALVPTNNIVFGGSGAVRTVTVTPIADQNGVATITVTVGDGQNSVGTNFVVAVTALNDRPTITGIADQTIDEDLSTGPLSFTLGDAETPVNSLNLSTGSSNPVLVPTNNIVFGGNGSNRTVTVSPAAGQSGDATITITVGDGQDTVSSDFVVTVTAVNDPPTITSLANQTINANETTGPRGFTIGDVDTPLTGLTLMAGSSDLTLVPINNIVFGGSGNNRTVTVTPATNQSGTATITVSVSDGQSSAGVNFMLTVSALFTGTRVLTNAAAITIPSSGNATPYPSTINVSGMAGVVSNASVTLNRISHQRMRDIDILLVGPGGKNLIVLSDVGPSSAGSNITLTLSDAAVSSLGTGTIVSGTYKPTNITTGDTFASPAPVAPYGAALSVFNGQLANGAWSLYVFDDSSGSNGTIAAGWSLTLTTVTVPPTITGITDRVIAVDGTTGPMSFTVGDLDTPLTNLTLGAGSSNPTLVSTNNIVFGGSGNNRTVTVTPVAHLTGNATITVTVSDGQHSVSTNFLVTVSTLFVGTKAFTNAAAITIPSVGAATPYPATINVGAMGGVASNVTVTLSRINHARMRDVDILLVGPRGHKTIMVSDVVPNSSVTNITLTLSDAAASSLGTVTLASGIYKPTNITTGDTFVSPAPAGPHGTNLATFNGSDPNGAWSLFVVDDNSGSIGSIAGGWSLTLTTVATNGSAVPTISNIPDQSTTMNTPTPAIPFTINDADTPASSLTLSAGSSNPTLVPTNNIVLGGSGTNRTVTVTPGAGQTGAATITVTVSDGTNSASDPFVLAVNAPNTPPTITGIADQAINEDTSTAALVFAVGDAETPPGSLTLSKSSSNPTLVPTNSIVFGGSGANRTVTASPVANQSGSATITITVNDGLDAMSTNFVVTVSAVNDAPTITGIATQTINVNTSTGPLSVTIGDVDTAVGSLALSGDSSNPTLVPTNNIVFGGSGTNRTVTVSPATNQTGNATITVRVSDGQSTTSMNFVVMVSSLSVETKSFTNATAITIPDSGKATPYPSTNNVTGMDGTITNVTVMLRSFSHTWKSDVDILLVSPGGQKVKVMSDAGSAYTASGSVTITLSDAAAGFLPIAAAISSGTYKPTDHTDSSPGGDNIPAPAPVGPYATNLSAFNGQSPNGTWSLYVFDDGPGDVGSFAGGWIVTITTGGAASFLAGLPDSVSVKNPPRITSLVFDQGDILLTVSGDAGLSYALEASNDLVNWSKVSVQTSETGLVVFRERPTTNSIRFYRAMSMTR